MKRRYKTSTDTFGWIMILLLVMIIWGLMLLSHVQNYVFTTRVESGRYVAEEVTVEETWEKTDHSRYATDRYTGIFARFHWYDADGQEYYADGYLVDMYYAGEEHEPLEPGDTVTVYYDRDDPSDLVVNESLYNGKHYGGFIFCTVMTLIFLVIFIWAQVNVYSDRKSRKRRVKYKSTNKYR